MKRKLEVWMNVKNKVMKVVFEVQAFLVVVRRLSAILNITSLMASL